MPMPIRGFSRTVTRILAATCAVAGVVIVGPASGARADDHPGVFVGTWVNDVKIVACAPGPPIVFATFQSMLTQTSDGTLVEDGSPAGLPPAVWRSAGLGIWKRTSAHRIVQAFRFNHFDSVGRLVSKVEVTSRPMLVHGDNPDTPDVEPYYLKGSGTNRITNLNPADGSVIDVTEGCSESTSAPVLFQH
jgi:hypothetical protein